MGGRARAWSTLAPLASKPKGPTEILLGSAIYSLHLKITPPRRRGGVEEVGQLCLSSLDSLMRQADHNDKQFQYSHLAIPYQQVL
jgi:hypothetical protein